MRLINGLQTSQIIRSHTIIRVKNEYQCLVRIDTALDLLYKSLENALRKRCLDYNF